MVQLLDGLQGLNGEPPQWHADRLVFINDVYFCARDAVRLLQHVSADLACSMDFLQWKDPPSTVNVYPYGVDGPPLSVGGLSNSIFLLGTQGTSSIQVYLQICQCGSAHGPAAFRLLTCSWARCALKPSSSIAIKLGLLLCDPKATCKMHTCRSTHWLMDLGATVFVHKPLSSCRGHSGYWR